MPLASNHSRQRQESGHRLRWVEWAGVVLMTLGTMAVVLMATGDRLLFLWPGYLALGAGFLFFCAGSFAGNAPRPEVRWLPVLSCLFLAVYVIYRASTSEVAYFGRKDGLLVAAFFLVYVAAAAFPVGRGYWMVWVLGLVAAGVVHVGMAAFQYFRDPDFVFWTAVTEGIYVRSGRAYVGRLSGGFNAPTHFAALLTSLFALAAGVAVVAGRMGVLWGMVAALFLIAQPLTFSRSGLAGTAAASILGLFLVVWLMSGVGWKQASGFAVAALLVLGAAGGAIWFKYGDEFQKRMAEGNKGNKGFLGNSARPAMWRAALAQAKVEPMLGTGSGSYEYFSKKLRDDSMPNWLRADSSVVHNEYLQLRAEYGKVGAILAGVFLSCHLVAGLATLRRERRLFRERKSRLSGRLQAGLVVASLAGVCGGLVHALADFNFHIPATLILMGLFFGILARRAEGQAGAAGTDTGNVRVSRWSPMASVALRGLGAVVATSVVIMGVPLARAEYELERGRLVEGGEPFAPIKVAFAGSAQKLDPRNPDAFLEAARWRIDALGATRGDADLQQRLEAIEGEYRRALRLYPQSLDGHLGMAAFLEGIGKIEGARRHYETSMTLAPGYGSVRMAYAGFLERQGMLEEAIKAYEHAGKARHYHDSTWKRRMLDVETEIKRRGFLQEERP